MIFQALRPPPNPSPFVHLQATDSSIHDVFVVVIKRSYTPRTLHPSPETGSKHLHTCLNMHCSNVENVV